MMHESLKLFLEKKRCTLLGVGPMSLNCVDAAIELANEVNKPLFLIASRRQIDSIEFGGGYVNNWTTQEFSYYVKNRDTGNNILIARDHGGPWQNNNEVDNNLCIDKAMESAKLSFLRDIEAGFHVLHIDPSVDIHSKPNINEVLERIFELYEYCWIESQRLGHEVIFEIGTEEQSGSTNTQEELEFTLNEVMKFCVKNNIQKPSFVVIQTGTRVMETRNVGSFDTPLRVANELPAEIQVPKMIEICNKYKIMMKQHNTDYLSDKALQWHPRLGIHSANVAPEFGVCETTALLTILEKNNLNKLADDFLKLAYNSMKWKKWMLEATSATDRDRSVIAGHYIFSTPDCQALKAKARSALAKVSIDLDDFLKNEIKKSIYRYMKNFRLTGV